MPLQEQVVEIPIQGGVDEKNSPKLTARLLSAVNCRYTKPGEIWKRYGVDTLCWTNLRLTAAATGVQPSTTPPVAEQLVDYSGELVRIGGGQLDAYAPSSTTDWAYRGRVSECTARVDLGRTVDTGPGPGAGFADPSSAYDGSRYYATAYVDASSGTQVVYVDIKDTTTGANLFSRYAVSTIGGQSYAPRVLFFNSRLFVVFSVSGVISYTSLDLSAFAWDTVHPFNGTIYGPAWDVVLYASSQLVIAADNISAGTLDVTGYTFTGSTVSTVTSVSAISYPTGTGQTVPCVSVDGPQTDGRVFVCYTVNAGSSGSDVRLVTVAVTSTTTTQQGTPYVSTSMVTTGSTYFPHVAVRRTSSTTASVVATAKLATASGAQDAAWFQEFTCLAGSPYTKTPAYVPARKVANACWISSPTLISGRAYAFLMNTHPRASSTFLVDLSLQETMPSTPRIVAVTLPERWRGITAYSDIPRGQNLARIVPAGTNLYAYPHTTGATAKNQPSIATVTLDFAYPRNSTVAGQLLILAGGCVQAYDGASIFEVGFAYQPNISTSAPDATSGGLTTGATYGYRVLWCWRDARGNVHRGIVSSTVSIALSGGQTAAKIIVDGLNLTNRPGSVQLEVYRTLANGSVYYYVTTVANVVNGSPQLIDTTSDSSIQASATAHPQLTLGSEVAQVIPPSAAFVHAHQNRVWLGNVDDDSIWFSKQLTVGDGVAFSDSFTFDAFERPRVRAFGTLDDKLLILKDVRTYMLAGDGPDDTNSTGSFSQIMAIQSDLGCIEPRSVVGCEDGVFFLSYTGIMLATREGPLVNVGQFIENTLGDLTIVAATYSAANNAVRFVVDRPSAGVRGVVLEYDNKSGTAQNPVWTTHAYYDSASSTADPTIVASCNRAGVWTFINSDGRVYTESSTKFYDALKSFSGGAAFRQYVPMSGQLSWLKAASLNGCQRVWYAVLLATYKDSHDMSMSLYTDYSASYDQSVSWNSAILAANLPEQLRVHVANQECGALSVAFADATPSLEPDFTTGQGPIINGVSLEVGVQSGVRKVPANRSR